jgi:PAS domain S-box-containing protein
MGRKQRKNKMNTPLNEQNSCTSWESIAFSNNLDMVSVLKTVFKSSNESFMFIDHDFVIRCFNDIAAIRAKQVFGVQVKSGDSVFSIVLQPDRENFKRNFKKALAGEFIEVEKHFQWDNSSFYFNFRYVPITSAEKNIVGVALIVDDITEKKKAEEEIRESKNRLELAANSAKLGIWDWDIVNNKMLWDDQMFQLYGITEKPSSYGVEIWKSGLHPDDINYAWEACQAAINGEKEYDIEFRVRHPDGVERIIKADGIVIRDSLGNAIRMVGINHDITNQRVAEEQHRKYEQQLQQTQKLESLGILAGGIAHDFNNLLGGIYGYIDLAGEGTNNEELSLYLSKAMNTIERARGLTQQLLTFAKGGVPIKKVGPLFPFVKETAQFALSGSNVTCKFEIPSDLSTCDFDRNQIGQVIDNIVINAKQAMPDGGTIVLTAYNVIIALNEHPFLASGDYIRISIKDYGIGMSKELLNRVFDPFYTTKATGHGLGLASCYSIVKQHGGCIDVESEPSKGSTFHVFLPASRELISSSSETSTTIHKGSGIFLVMDDEEVMQETFRAILEMLGYTVECRKNGKEAIDFVFSEMKANREIAGMVFDLTVPGGMGGIEAIGEIRKMGLKTPVFVTSGYAEDPIMANPSSYGFTASICKPFRKSELSEMLNKYIHTEK